MLHRNWLYSSVTLSILLGACSITDVEQEETLILSDEIEDKEDLFVNQSQSIIKNTIDVEKELKNYEATIKITDFISSQTKQVEKVTEGALAYQKEPEITYTTFSRYGLDQEGNEEKVEESLSVLATEAAFFSNYNGEGWEESNSDVEFSSLLSLHYSPKAQLSLLQGISEFVSVREYDDLYILSIEANGDDLDDMALHMELFDQSLLGIEDIPQHEGTFEVSQLDFLLFINKDSFQLEKSTTVFEFVIHAPNEEYAIRKNVTVTRPSVNNPEGIQYPSVH
ncbi:MULTISPECIES: DUF6612 family protein [Shouchella]|uniref:Lipoprotein n=3 Tax=Bacillaceae TaxID=186817 RepID=A0A060M0S2_9BACI|nr:MULTISPECIES: DUF6612 family protein [Bacillaceae]RQW21326.1 hypothetical protein EH196_14895 [Bacillus sp. C1-1]AIC95605.1 hypothetical protein BleG1_3041 [Shouchella lehensis G1]KQL55725.1 hypothetical protein AN965_17905 [Alkalicoccobacillus plakortidis]MBG9783693.1 hypothetical protein [Shouchella lehensis]TES51358.1 hypothetical protein E2L03_05410 [Shouchella lehensis]